MTKKYIKRFYFWQYIACKKGCYYFPLGLEKGHKSQFLFHRQAGKK